MNGDAAIRGRVEALIRGEERSAEIGAGLVRIVSGMVLVVVLAAAGATVPAPEWVAMTRYRTAMLVIAAFIASGVVGIALARSRFYRPQLAYAFIALDALLVGVFLHRNLASNGLPGDFAAASPVVWLLPLLLAVAVLRFRPGVQLFALVALATAIVAVVIAPGPTAADGGPGIAGQAGRYFVLQPNLMRFAMLLLAGALLVVVAWRGRSLLVRALAESEHRATLTRFLPAEIGSLALDVTAGGLSRGRRQRAAVMFVDIRDSTARAENLDPERLSVFISAFRNRVTRAAERHRGVIDKFIGDGALVVFGLPASAPDDATRALACARTLLDLVERWNRKRQFDPPVRVGIGVHAGEVFFGVVGDEKRMELTVLGDAVNVASRLEQATKEFDVPLLASADAVEAAGEASAWTEVSHGALRGRAGPVRVMRPA